jgi:hypothetical protein
MLFVTFHFDLYLSSGVGPFECGNEPLGSKKVGEFLDYLSIY